MSSNPLEPIPVAAVDADSGEKAEVGQLKRGVHLPALDGIRGFAILLVLMTHANGTGPTFAHGLWKIPQLIFEGGWAGVDLFFVLSGFLITGILVDSLGKAAYFKNFYARRSLRIFPLYYITAALYLFVVIPLALHLHPNQKTVDALLYSKQHGWYFWFYLQNFMPFLIANHNDSHIMSHFWSLAVEEHFYLFWPLCVYLLRGRILYLCGALFFFSIGLRLYLLHHGYNASAVYQFTFTRLEGLTIGSFIAAYLRQDHKFKLDSLVVPGLVLSGAGIVAIVVADHRFYNMLPHNAVYGFTLLPIFFGCVLLKSIDPNSWLNGFFSAKFLRELGKYSYGIYMTHRVFLLFFAPLWTHKFGLNFAWQVVYFPIVLLVSLGIAKIVYAVIEKPFLNLKSRYSNTYAKPASA